MKFPIPDFIVEVLSESTEARDRGVKFEDYAVHGVGEYWIIDTESETVEQYLPGPYGYELKVKAATGTITSGVIAGLSLPVRAIFDEVENLAVARDRASLQANPTDVHRSTNAVLTGLDSIWNQFTNVLFVATSNFPDSIDAAFLSRVDLIVDVPVPPRELARRILVDTMREVAGDAIADAEAADESVALEAVLDATEGIDARRLRKVILAAIVERRETAIDPSQLRWQDVRAALVATGRAG